MGSYIAFKNLPGISAIAIALILAAIVGCSKDKAVAPNANIPPYHLIAFISDDGLSTIDAEGNYACLVEEDSLMQPVWSADRSKILFIKRTGGQSGDSLRVINADGADDQVIAGGNEYIDFGETPWSYDGAFIVFSDTDAEDIKIVSSSGGEPISLLQNAGEASFISDERIICEYVMGNGRSAIVNIAATGGDTIVLASYEDCNCFLPRFTPRLNGIAFARSYIESSSDSNEIWIMDTNGSGKQILATGGIDFPNGRVIELKFSHDGEKLLFVVDRDDQTAVNVLDLARDSLWVVADCEDVNNSAADWAPADDWIVFWQPGGGIAIIKSDGTNLIELDENGRYPCW